MQMIKNNQKNMCNTEMQPPIKSSKKMRPVAFCKRVKIRKIKKRAKISPEKI